MRLFKKQIKMKIQTLFFTIVVALILITSCQKDDNQIESIPSVVGQWKYEYEILSDGTKVFDNPYALLEFEYSDGFILNDNNTGNSVWYDKVNGDFEWTTNNSILIISITKSDNSIDKFEYQISNLNEKSMELETPKGAKYLMKKQ